MMKKNLLTSFYLLIYVYSVNIDIDNKTFLL